MATVTQSYPRLGGGYLDGTSAERDNGSNTAPHPLIARPNIVRRDTDQILSYYQSEYAGLSHDYDDDDDEQQQQRAGLSRRGSSASKSSSDYSSESTRRNHAARQADDSQVPSSVAGAAGHTRRPSVPSQESVDRRRLAIVELDNSLAPSVRRKEISGSEGTGVSSRSALLSRRGVHVNGLALVAPPDASPATYTNLTPPPTAPIVVGDRGASIAPRLPATHTRSTSETTGRRSHLRHKTSRDIGIVGIGAIHTLSGKGTHPSPPRDTHTDTTLQVPIFQTPSKSRSPSPAAQTPDLADRSPPAISDSLHHRSWNHLPGSGDRQQVSTPSIGEGKDIQQPVVGPVVVGLHSGKVIRGQSIQSMDSHLASVAQGATNGSLYAHYEPGVHSTAGPLPTPPRTMFDIASDVVASTASSPAPPPRPPRLRTPMPISQTSMSPVPARRDLEALKESLQLPQSVASALASRSTSRPDLKRTGTDVSFASSHSDITTETTVSDSALDPKRSRSIHRREGAFPPSIQSTAKSTPEVSPIVTAEKEAPSRLPSEADVDSIPPRPASPESEYEDSDDWHRRPAIELKRDPSWVSLKDTAIASSPNGKGHALPGSRSSSHSRSPAPQLPPKPSPRLVTEDIRSPSSTHSGSSNPFKTTLHNLKRFSALPRTPSSHSMKSSPHTDSTPRSPRTPSPAMLTIPATPRQKVINPWPDAMTFRDVSAMKSPLERATAYEQKIQELSACDTGLSNWLNAMQQRGTSNRPTRKTVSQLDIGLSHPSAQLSAIQSQPRHVSHGSVASEATFPIRRDAYTAADLMMKPDDDLDLTKAPPMMALPYPSLPMSSSPRSALTTPPTPRSYQVPLSSGSSRSGTGFFSSMGRKASLKKSDSPPTPNRVLTKRGPSRTTQPQMTSAPTIPGGPRAPPSRLQRSQTMSVAAPSSAPVDQPPVSISRSDTRASVTSRRPSFFHRSAAAQPAPPTDAEFERQVNKLADLLPHADRDVLGGYLRRAGQDILAIGQYLEDEKKGAIRYD
ncbi:hypothetical protein BC835DRAFT_625879 [Cytidiella melzeri]|nr:hypothetical protein BC835DRAFT_625879 [Cytidiella melzeri]